MDAASFSRTLTVAERTNLVIPGFGIHPWHAHLHVNDLTDIEYLFEQGSFVGEIGLDYRWVRDTTLYPVQRRVFECQLEIARNQGKLVNIHTSGAEQHVLDLVEQSGVDRL